MGSPSIDTLFRALQRVRQQGGISVLSGGAADWYEVMLFPAAPENEILRAMQTLGRRLPDDFLRFWLQSNGANLYVNESGLHGVGIASTDLILELHREEAELYGPGELAHYAVFARVNGSGDFLVFDLETGRVLDAVHAERPHEWRPIAESFGAWLARLIEAEGRYFWLEALYDADAEG